MAETLHRCEAQVKRNPDIGLLNHDHRKLISLFSVLSQEHESVLSYLKGVMAQVEISWSRCRMATPERDRLYQQKKKPPVEDHA